MDAYTDMKHYSQIGQALKKKLQTYSFSKAIFISCIILHDFLSNVKENYAKIVHSFFVDFLKFYMKV